MTIENTSDIKPTGNLVMVVYGKGGVGKTTFAATAPEPLILDFENGTKYLGERGFNVKVARIQEWFKDSDKKDLSKIIEPFKTIILDPLGEAMEKLINGNTLSGAKYRQHDGSLTMSGWGEAKKQMRNFIKWLRDSGKNIILVAHVSEEKNGEELVNRIQVATKLREEIPNIVDVISYMGVKTVEGKQVRLLYTPRQGDLFDSKDRTGRIPVTIEISEENGFQDFLNAMTPVKKEIKEPIKTPKASTEKKEEKAEPKKDDDVVTAILNEAANLMKENKGLFQSFELKQLRDEYDAVKTKNDAIAFNEKVIEMIGKRDTRFDDSGVPWGDQKEFEDDKIPEPEKKKEAIGIY
ncbi:MAG: ATP-binding protein [Spirochaetaceae bacterium]|nr:ATP-binding protein [Spirochaetaceae bacterium]